MINQYKILKTSFWSFFQMIFMHLGAFIITVFLTRVLTTAEFGLLSVVNTIVLLSVIIFGLGLPGSVARYLAKSITLSDKVCLVRDTMILSLISLVFFVFFLYLCLPLYAKFSNQIILNEYTLAIFFLFIFEYLRMFSVKVCNSLGVMHIAAMQSFIVAILLVIFTGFVLYVEPSVGHILQARSIALFVSLIFILSVLLKYREIITFHMLDLRRVSFFEIFKYGLPLSFTHLSSFLFVQTNIIILSIYTDSTNVALYSISAFLLARLLIVSFSIGMGLGPKFAVIKEASSDSDLLVLKTGILFSLMFAVPIFIMANVIGDELLLILFGSKYSDSSWILSMMGYFFIMQSIVAVIGPVLDYSGHAKKRAKATFIGGLVNIVLSVYLVESMGVRGVIISTIAGYCIVFIVSMYELINITNYTIFFNKKTLLLIVVILPSMHYVMLGLDGFFGDGVLFFVIKFIIFFVLYIILIFTAKLVRLVDVISFVKN